jgi:hypothetical protein
MDNVLGGEGGLYRREETATALAPPIFACSPSSRAIFFAFDECKTLLPHGWGLGDRHPDFLLLAARCDRRSERSRRGQLASIIPGAECPWAIALLMRCSGTVEIRVSAYQRPMVPREERHGVYHNDSLLWRSPVTSDLIEAEGLSLWLELARPHPPRRAPALPRPDHRCLTLRRYRAGANAEASDGVHPYGPQRHLS